jgi:hypothetical protein
MRLNQNLQVNGELKRPLTTTVSWLATASTLSLVFLVVEQATLSSRLRVTWPSHPISMPSVTPTRAW